MNAQKVMTPWLVRLLIVAAVIVGLWLLVRHTSSAWRLETSDEIGLTPEQIQSIKDIGQWEFLAVSDEELVDTTRRGFFSDDHLARIYYGTLRLGIDLSEVSDGWMMARGDTIDVLLPHIRLLDDHFIDEALTKSFHETGRWSAKDREAMYRKAEALMRRHCLTPQNVRSAEVNAEAQMRQLLRTMGFQKVTIQFEP